MLIFISGHWFNYNHIMRVDFDEDRGVYVTLSTKERVILYEFKTMHDAAKEINRQILLTKGGND